jgi:XTP/dITP diphosphohydrolase
VGLLDATAPGAINVTDEDELGPLLLAIVASAKANGLDSERALRSALRGLSGEIQAHEGDVALAEATSPESDAS